MPFRLNERFAHLKLSDLRPEATLGVGGFGRVELVTLADNKSVSYALKVMKKAQIVETRQQQHILNEKQIMLESNCSFIAKLFKTFKGMSLGKRPNHRHTATDYHSSLIQTANICTC